MGEGDLPVDAMMMALQSINYEGYVSLEWVKRWASDLEDAGIVFPHFADYEALPKSSAVRSRLCITTPEKPENTSGKRIPSLI